MGRAVVGLLLGFTLVFGVAYWARTCLPDPNEKDIEWVERPNAIVVQIKTVDDAGGLDPRLIVPEFTLYGDGTVITDGRSSPFPGGPHGPLVWHLSSDDTRSLLQSTDDDGFFDLAYEQTPSTGPNSPATYIYVSSLLAANSVRYSSVSPDPADTKEADRVKKLQKIVDRFIRAELQGEPHLYPPGSFLFIARPASPERGPRPFDLPDAIDVSRPDDSGVIVTTVSANDLSSLSQMGPGTEGLAADDRGTFAVGYRPILPYEENFPEFDPPS